MKQNSQERSPLSFQDSKTVDDIIMEAAGQGLDSYAVMDIVKRELKRSGLSALWSDAEIKKAIALQLK